MLSNTVSIKPIAEYSTPVAEPTPFRSFPKVPRLAREMVITEKIDGSNAQIFIGEGGEFYTGSRNRITTPNDDNLGFSAWAHHHKDELLYLGPGRHFGEWWGYRINRGYGQAARNFSLFNVSRWSGCPDLPPCCRVVPVLYKGPFDSIAAIVVLNTLQRLGSQAARGFMNPEGIVIFHTQANALFKKTFVGDEQGKS